MITPQKPRYCAVCGADISERFGSAIYCRECAEQIAINKRRNRRTKRKSTGANETIVQIAQKARNAGMTYGQYVARMKNET